MAKKKKQKIEKLRVEQPHELAQHMSEDQMSRFIDLLLSKGTPKKEDNENQGKELENKGTD